MAIKLGLSINNITRALQVMIIVVPPLAYWVTKRICLSLQRRDHDLVLHGRETGRVVRTAEGSFFEVHEPLPEHERWTLVQHETGTPVEARATIDANGVRRASRLKERLRGRVSGFYFTDVVHPVTPAELAAAHHDGVAHEAIGTGPDDGEADWVGQLHGGADERPETDAYASHEDQRTRRRALELAQLPSSSVRRADRLGSSPRSSSTFVREVSPLTRSTSARRSPNALATALSTASVAAPSTARCATRTIRTASWPAESPSYSP